MRCLNSVLLGLLVLLAVLPAFSAETALFWHAYTSQDTLLVERLAPRIAQFLVSQNRLINPEELQDNLPKEAFSRTVFADSLFFQRYPNATRIDVSLRRFGSSQTLLLRQCDRINTDTTRFFYPGRNDEVADWLQRQLLLKLNWNPEFKPGFGSISVDGSPSAARILIDGKDTGYRLPATISNVPAGEHLIEIAGDYVSAQLVAVSENSIVGVNLRGRIYNSLLEITSDPPGLNVDIDGVNSGATPYLRESVSGSYSVTVSGTNMESIIRLVDLERGQWKVLSVSPRFIHRVVVYSIPPGAVLYNGPVRIGVAGDTLPCSPDGEDWMADHPYAYPLNFHVKGNPGKITPVEIKLPPALSYLRLKNWYQLSRLAINDSTVRVTRPDSQAVLAGMRRIDIFTDGCKTRRYTMDLERGMLHDIEAEPIPEAGWRSATYSMMVPGLGQLIDGSKWRSISFFTLTAIAGYCWSIEDRRIGEDIYRAQSAETRYRKSINASSASTWATTADGFWSDAKSHEKDRNFWAAATVACWSAAVLDRIVFPSQLIQVKPSTNTAGVRISMALGGKP